MSYLLSKKITQGSITESLVVPESKDVEMVCQMIRKTMPKIQVVRVKEVRNSFLEGMYMLKKQEYKSRNGMEPKEELLFHVTGASNVSSILKDNFDWRRTKRGLFGLGTSFSGDAEYANHYANNNIGEERAVIVTKVLVSKTTVGQDRMKIPHKKYDTATGNENKVYVKFSDNEILPKYVVYFSLNFSKNQKKSNECTSKKNQHSKSKRSTAGLPNPKAETKSEGPHHAHHHYRSSAYNEEDEWEDYNEGEWDEDYGDEYEEGEYEDDYDENCEEEEGYEEDEEYCEEEEDEYDEECEDEYCEDEEEEYEEDEEEEEYDEDEEGEYDEDEEEEYDEDEEEEYDEDEEEEYEEDEYDEEYYEGEEDGNYYYDNGNSEYYHDDGYYYENNYQYW